MYEVPTSAVCANIYFFIVCGTPRVTTINKLFIYLLFSCVLDFYIAYLLYSQYVTYIHVNYAFISNYSNIMLICCSITVTVWKT